MKKESFKVKDKHGNAFTFFKKPKKIITGNDTDGFDNTIIFDDETMKGYCNFRNRLISSEKTPSVITNFGLKKYYQYGNCHRMTGPAQESKTHKSFWQQDRLHRLAAAAVIDEDDMTYEYHFAGILHREDGPAKCFIQENPDKYVLEYYFGGKLCNGVSNNLEFEEWKLMNFVTPTYQLNDKFGNVMYFNKNWEKYWVVKDNKEGFLHGVKFMDGTELYGKEDLSKFFHHDSLPAYFNPRWGGIEFYKHGKLHNLTDAAICIPGECYEYYIDGKLHNENGPAISNCYEDDQYYIEGNQCIHLGSKVSNKEEFDLWKRFKNFN